MSFDINMYFSGSMKNAEPYLMGRDVHRLFTYAYPEEIFHYMRLAQESGTRLRLMQDCGAFTSWSIGKPVVLEQLIEYNKKVLACADGQHQFVFIALDVIPGERGRRATEGEIKQAQLKSIDNFKVMQQEFAGHRVVPVYHSGEDLSVRDTYYGLTDYICLSMNQDMSERDRVAWAQRVITPGFMHHGLAATGNRMLSRIDWYSVDSSGWLMVAAMGCILYPRGNELFSLPVSHDSPVRRDAGKHVDTLSPMEHNAVVDTLAAGGYTLEDIRTDYMARIKWNIDRWCNPPWEKQLAPVCDLFAGHA